DDRAVVAPVRRAPDRAAFGRADRTGVGREVVVERPVLLDDEHDVLDRRLAGDDRLAAVARGPAGARPTVRTGRGWRHAGRARRGPPRAAAGPGPPQRRDRHHDDAEEHREATPPRGPTSVEPLPPPSDRHARTGSGWFAHGRLAYRGALPGRRLLRDASDSTSTSPPSTPRAVGPLRPDRSSNPGGTGEQSSRRRACRSSSTGRIAGTPARFSSSNGSATRSYSSSSPVEYRTYVQRSERTAQNVGIGFVPSMCSIRKSERHEL